MRPSLFIVPVACAALVIAAFVAYTPGGSASPASVVPAGATVTQHLVLDSTDFVSQDNTCTLKVGNSHGIGGTSDPNGCQNWMASVHVPDDSTIVGIKVTYSDTAQFANLFLALHERSLDGQSGVDTALSGQLPDPGNADINFASLIADVPVDNHFEHYDLEMVMDVPGIVFFSAVVTFTEPAGGSANLIGDADCSGVVDTLDDLALLKHQAGFPDNPSCLIG